MKAIKRWGEWLKISLSAQNGQSALEYLVVVTALLAGIVAAATPIACSSHRIMQNVEHQMKRVDLRSNFADGPTVDAFLQ